MKYPQIIAICLVVLACKAPGKQALTAEAIIDQSIAVSGGEHIAASLIEFDFRDKHYSAKRHKGVFQLERIFVDSIAQKSVIIKDVLSNSGFQRYVDNKVVHSSDSVAARFAASVNSVHYFSVLPYGLNDAAVQKTLLKEQPIKNQMYYTVKVTFDRDGGGEDFEDVFLYWVHKQTFKVDYLAYSYNESEGRGYRFREAYNERYIEDVRFVDYNNYKPKDLEVELIELANLFEQGALTLVSKIELESVSVVPLIPTQAPH